MKHFALRFFGLSVLMILMGQGCSLTGEAPVPLDGGVFATEDGGVTWAHRVLIPSTTGAPGSIATVNVNALVMDPLDRKALYAGTNANGMIFSYDQGRTWSQPADLRGGKVSDVAVDPRDKCIVFVAVSNRITKTDDCSRNYIDKHVDEKKTVTVNALEIDPKNSKVIYAATSAGSILKSENGGSTWQIKHSFERDVAHLLINPNDTNIIYAGLRRNGIHKSADGGSTWIDITPETNSFSSSGDIKNIVWHKKSNTLFLAMKSKMFSSTNGGDAWTALDLISPADANIFALAINPKDGRQIIYSTATGRSSTLYVTSDGGKTWTSAQPPTTRAVTSILFDPEAPHIMYLGGFALAQ